MAALRFRAIDLPHDAPGALVDRHQVRAKALIARQDDVVADDHRRGAHAVDVVERTERHRPALFARAVVGDHAVVGEEHVDAVFFDRGTRRCRVVALVDDSRLYLRRRPLPQRFAGRAIDRDGDERVVRAHAREVDTITERGSARNDPAATAVARADSCRARIRSVRASPRDARPVRPAESRPLAGVGRSAQHGDRQRDKKQSFHPGQYNARPSRRRHITRPTKSQRRFRRFRRLKRPTQISQISRVLKCQHRFLRSRRCGRVHRGAVRRGDASAASVGCTRLDQQNLWTLRNLRWPL